MERPTASFVAIALPVLGSLALAACGGSAPRPTAQHTEATAAIRAADEVGAKGEPKAALYLKMAQDGIANAEILLENEENGKARRVLERARSDAELALVLTRSANKRKEADDALRRVEKLTESDDE